MKIGSLPVSIVEAVFGLLLGAAFGVVNWLFLASSPAGWALSLAAPVGSMLLTIQRKALEESFAKERDDINATLARDLLPLRKIADYIEIGPDADYSSLNEVVRRFAAITEPEFSPVKQKIVKDATEQLRLLAINKRSSTLQTGDYYDWLFRQFGTLGNGEYVHAVSMSSDEEWNDSDLERNFLRANIDAAERGVRVERIFIVESKRIAEFLTRSPIDQHTKESEAPLIGYLVKNEEVTKYDPNLLKQIGEGFIDFNGRVGLEDRFDPSGSARGEVTMLDVDLSRMLEIYNKLIKMATPLSRTSS
ncbi:hypothetical protein [Glycomyces sp. MUSA5-2]|uniref:hypothetical protein n=1 Tax=Glycomyces sp. MUSA5-2 TaxID=2053002 RepID=UPI003009DFCD